MKTKRLIYDLPTRLFHGLFALLFIIAFVIAKSVDDDSPRFSYHMLAGLILGILVLLRIGWGFIGSKYARFSSFALAPRDLANYFRDLFSSYGEKRWPGHNPASSWAAILMMASALGLGITGLLMVKGHKEQFENLHEIFANGFLVLVLLHLAGLFLHSLRHKDGIGMSMLHGEKSDQSSFDEIPNSQVGFALIFIVLVLSWAGYLVKHYNAEQQSLKIFGNTLQLGELEDENK